MPGSTVFTPGHDVSSNYSGFIWNLVDSLLSQLHRMRRAKLSSFFSKASVRRLEPLVAKTVNKLTDALQTHQKSGEPVVVSRWVNGAMSFCVVLLSLCALALTLDLLSMSLPITASLRVPTCLTTKHWRRACIPPLAKPGLVCIGFAIFLGSLMF